MIKSTTRLQLQTIADMFVFLSFFRWLLTLKQGGHIFMVCLPVIGHGENCNRVYTSNDLIDPVLLRLLLTSIASSWKRFYYIYWAEQLPWLSHT